MESETVSAATDIGTLAPADAQDLAPSGFAGAAAPVGSPPGGPVSSRRRFMRYLLGFTAVSTLALISAPVIAFLVPTKELSAGTTGKTLAGTTTDIPPGTGKVVAMGSKPTIVVNSEQGVKAYSAICTHLGCIVTYDDQSTSINCPCHGGRFSPTTGAVISGPPPTPLAPVTVSVEGDQIFLVGA